jgi:copper chaperone CopZ
MEHAVVAVEGMSCGHCVARVTRAIQAVPGVRVDHVEIGEVRAAYDPAVASEDRIREAIAAAGFTPRPPAAP